MSAPAFTATRMGDVAERRTFGDNARTITPVTGTFETLTMATAAATAGDTKAFTARGLSPVIEMATAERTRLEARPTDQTDVRGGTGAVRRIFLRRPSTASATDSSAGSGTPVGATGSTRCARLSTGQVTDDTTDSMGHARPSNLSTEGPFERVIKRATTDARYTRPAAM